MVLSQDSNPTSADAGYYDVESELELGRQLVKLGLLSDKQLDQALQEQQTTRLKLGELCLEHGWISPLDFYSLTPSSNLALGEILVLLGYLEFDQLRVALSQQRRFGRRLGEVLVWKGWLQPEDLEDALKIQTQIQQHPSDNAWEALQGAIPTHQPTPEAIDEDEEFDPEPLFETDLDTIQSVSVIQDETDEAPVQAVGTELAPDTESRSSEIQPKAPPESPARATQAWSWRVAPPRGSTPDDYVARERSYLSRIHELEHYIQLREQEWDVLTAEMNQQVNTFQEQYLKRISQLEAKIKSQDMDLQLKEQTSTEDATQLKTQLSQLDTLLQQAQHQIESLESSLQGSNQLISSLEHELEQTRVQVQKGQLQLQKQRIQYNQELNRLQLQQEESKSQEPLPDSAEEAGHLQQQLEQLQQALTQAQAQIQTYESQLQAYHQMDSQTKQLQLQLTTTQNEVAEAQSARTYQESVVQRLQSELDALQATSAQSATEITQLTQQVHELQNALQAKSFELERTQQQITTLKSQSQTQEQRRAMLASELEHTKDLLSSYRQSVESLQVNLKASQDHNHILQAGLDQQRLIAEAAQAEISTSSLPIIKLLESRLTQSHAPAPDTNEIPEPLSVDQLSVTQPAPPTTNGSAATGYALNPGSGPHPSTSESVQFHLDQADSDLGTLPVLTPWARTLFFNLQEAGLVNDQHIEQVLSTWQRQGGKLTQVLSDCTGLDLATVRFFSDGGYSAKLSGCQRLGDYLKAAGLVTEDQILEVIERRQPSQLLGEALVEQGYVKSATIDYFMQVFMPGA